MSGVNKIIVVGNICKDAELRATKGDSVVNFTVAVNETWKDKSGEKKERVEFVRCCLWGPRDAGR